MKNSLLACLLFLTGMASAQNLTGDWGGTLVFGSMELKIVFHITANGDGYTSTLDSPDQGVKDVPVTRTTVDGNNLTLIIDAIGGEYSGTLSEDQSITGTFKQAGQALDLKLTRDGAKVAERLRPQEPKAPFPYDTEDVMFKNPEAENISLAGTLTLPKGKAGKKGFPVVVLISGSGPQNRDEELLLHKPFLVLADHLTRNGIAVLRFDDRGVGKSAGNFRTATSMDFATDVEAAVAYLKTRKEIDSKKIGLVGHSEGGLIAPMVASRNKDVAFIVLLAGPGIRGTEILLMQQELIARAKGTSEEEIADTKRINTDLFELILKETDSVKLKEGIKALLTKEFSKLPDSLQHPGMMEEVADQLDSPWMMAFMRFDPATVLTKVKCPVLALNGSKDLQVPADVDLAAIDSLVRAGGNQNVTVMKLEGLNHLFQECTTGSPDEYIQIEQTMSPVVLNAVSEWIEEQVK